MYYSYSYHSMKPKAGMFSLSMQSASYTSTYTYESWKSYLDGYSASEWTEFCKAFAEGPQFAFLRAMAVVGIGVSDWSSVLRDLKSSSGDFQGILKGYMAGILELSWTTFATLVASDTRYPNHFPPVYPEWLFRYGYDQHQYLRDLAVYWDNIHEDYYKPWDTTRIGDDSPEVLRLKYLGNLARKEIDEVAKHSAQHFDPFSTLPDAWPADPYVQGVEELFNSLEWVYLTHRYEEDNLGMLLRLLTLSGLDPSWWRRYLFHLIARNQTESSVLQLMAQEHFSLFDGVNEIWEYANEKDAPVGEPPLQPTYLEMFAYSQEEYLEDLEEVYDQVPNDRYYNPWPDDGYWVMEKPEVEQGSLHHAVAIMGTTAGAIEWIVQKGSVDG